MFLHIQNIQNQLIKEDIKANKIGFENDTGPSMMFFYEEVETEDSHNKILQQVMLRIEKIYSNSFSSILQKNNKWFRYFIKF